MSHDDRPRALTGVADLLREGLARPEDAPALAMVEDAFRIRITPEMRGAIGAADGPMARQFVPSPREMTIHGDELADPIGDEAHRPLRGLTHRYPDRVILHVTQTCAVYCRFCFRREAVGEEGALPEADLAAALDYIRARPAIWEAILTGGDPLVLSPRRIAALVTRLAGIGHVEMLRIHTRVPVVDPRRITPELVTAITGRLTTTIVIHANHADELTPAATQALARLADAGIPLLAQTVLLRGVNDSADALARLFRALMRHRVKPYYLHHCDLARGTSHFRTTIAAGQRIMAELRGQISGICLPTYVLDIPGGYGKVPLGPGYLSPGGDGAHHLVRDPAGGLHRYADPAGD